tara:strand:- start:193 stop:675 length:483 start_codon:yes stop_codon:yes gene_type:complete
VNKNNKELENQVKIHSKIYKTYCDDLAKIIQEEIGYKISSLEEAIDPKLCAEDKKKNSVKTIYDYIIDQKEMSNSKSKVETTLLFYLKIELNYRKSDENIPLLLTLFCLLAAFQDPKKLKFKGKLQEINTDKLKEHVKKEHSSLTTKFLKEYELQIKNSN